MIIFQPIKGLFPCPACLQPANGLCNVCAGYLSGIELACHRCALPIQSGEYCGHCLNKPPAWDQAVAPWAFDGLTRFLIHQFKYQNDKAAGRALVQQWLNRTNDQRQPVDAIIAVPMHRRRQAERGYNQATLIARQMSQKLNHPCFTGITRTRQTGALEGLTRIERQKELSGAFELTQKPPTRVAIVDDVLTTGATANTLTKLLKQNGCQDVSVWAFARTPLGQNAILR